MPPSSRAPRRTVLADFCGRPLTLSGDARQWDAAGPEEGDCLLLGLGPDEPASLPFVPDRRAVYWLECPETRRALPGAPVPPPSWREVSPEEAVALSPRCRRHFYRPGLRLAPAFWGPLLGRMEAACCPLPSRPASSRRLCWFCLGISAACCIWNCAMPPGSWAGACWSIRRKRAALRSFPSSGRRRPMRPRCCFPSICGGLIPTGGSRRRVWRRGFPPSSGVWTILGTC